MRVRIIWEDCIACFVCPVCGEEHIADSQNEPFTCKCGSVYELVSYIKGIFPIGSEVITEIGTELPLTK